MPIVFRHKRVVFGLCSSPFLLGATIQYHLGKMLSTSPPEWKWIIQRLKRSFYVDNCVTSVSNKRELQTFISQASQIMSRGHFDLRGWES
uniref:Putative reverse transcriptase n=1 Tax=Panstrongylus lignarius TaxID=156445 RepID=A0A224Y3Z1_9HEMI